MIYNVNIFASLFAITFGWMDGFNMEMESKHECGGDKYTQCLLLPWKRNIMVIVWVDLCRQLQN